MPPLAGETIPASPIGALRAALSFGIVDSLLMRAAQNAIRRYHRFGPVKPDEMNDGLIDCGIVANILLIGKPALKVSRLATFVGNQRRDYLAGMRVVRPVVSHGGQRISLKALLAFLAELIAEPFCFE